MQYYFFHLMSWPFLTDSFAQEHDSAWVWAPNSLYDPVKGCALYREYIDTLAYADELGFDGVCVNEHHQTAYGLMPSPNIMAAALARRTERAKIMVLGNAIGIRGNPLRVAADYLGQSDYKYDALITTDKDFDHLDPLFLTRDWIDPHNRP